MPKSKTRKPKARKISWRRMFMYFSPVIIVVFLVFNHLNNGNVLGVNDAKLFSKESKVATSLGSKCKPVRLTSFSVNGACDSESRKNGFKSVSYTCADGKTGSVNSSSCVNIHVAYEKALKACNSGSNCKEGRQKTETSPKPTGTEEIKVEKFRILKEKAQ